MKNELQQLFDSFAWDCLSVSKFPDGTYRDGLEELIDKYILELAKITEKHLTKGSVKSVKEGQTMKITKGDFKG